MAMLHMFINSGVYKSLFCAVSTWNFPSSGKSPSSTRTCLLEDKQLLLVEDDGVCTAFFYLSVRCVDAARSNGRRIPLRQRCLSSLFVEEHVLSAVSVCSLLV